MLHNKDKILHTHDTFTLKKLLSNYYTLNTPCKTSCNCNPRVCFKRLMIMIWAYSCFGSINFAAWKSFESVDQFVCDMKSRTDPSLSKQMTLVFLFLRWMEWNCWWEKLRLLHLQKKNWLGAFSRDKDNGQNWNDKSSQWLSSIKENKCYLTVVTTYQNTGTRIK